MSRVSDAPDRLPDVDYSDYSNAQLIAIPLVVLALALTILAGWYVMTGAPVSMGTEFTGGTQIRVGVPAGTGEAAVSGAFEAEVESLQYVPATEQYIVTFGPEVDDDQVRSAVESNEQLDFQGLSQVSASFGAGVQQTALMGILIAFVGMSLLVFALFRTFVPSIAVVASAFSDIIVPLALMNVVGIKLTMGTVAALLMLIGYSVDSDILLNNHVLRRSGGFYESTYAAMKTGVTMTVTSIAAMLAMAITATLFGVQLLASIGIILVFGLVTDLMNTYMLNVTLLRWYKYEGVTR